MHASKNSSNYISQSIAVHHDDLPAISSILSLYSQPQGSSQYENRVHAFLLLCTGDLLSVPSYGSIFSHLPVLATYHEECS